MSEWKQKAKEEFDGLFKKSDIEVFKGEDLILEWGFNTPSDYGKSDVAIIVNKCSGDHCPESEEGRCEHCHGFVTSELEGIDIFPVSEKGEEFFNWLDYKETNKKEELK